MCFVHHTVEYSKPDYMGDVITYNSGVAYCYIANMDCNCSHFEEGSWLRALWTDYRFQICLGLGSTWIASCIAYAIHRDAIHDFFSTKENYMSLSFGTWILIILAMVVVTKVAHRLSLKTLFRPAKKANT
jgi:hypothetical protein